ncbi:MAG: sulfatase-like hydrolase/transferase [Planctomycetes bacterium]|nr:sulfatase-like hydrolase/transferase [Planctomycetota bacterium]
MEPRALSAQSEIAQGVIRGALVGVLCAALEGVFLSLASRVWFAPRDFAPQLTTAISTGAFVGVYALLGAAWGTLVGVAVSLSRRWIAESARTPCVVLGTTALVPLAFVAHSLLDGVPESVRVLALASVAGALAVALLGGIFWEPARPLATRWLGPWGVTFACVGAWWLTSVAWRGQFAVSRIALTVGVVGAGALLAFLLRSLAWNRSAFGAVPILLVAVASIVLCGVLDEPVPLIREERRLQRCGPGQPNVLLVTLDTTRADHLTDWGYTRDTTPTLSAFGKEALRFQNAISAADLTLPSHASLFTGLYPPAHGATPGPTSGHGPPLRQEFVTLAEILCDAGFTTYGIIANSGYLGTWYGCDQGFEYYDDRKPVPPIPVPPNSIRQRLVKAFAPSSWENWFSSSYRKADEIADEMLKTIDRCHETGERWFLFANFMDAHPPYDPPPPYCDRYPGRIEGYRFDESAGLLERINGGQESLDPKLYDHLVSLYDGGLSFMDAELDRVFRRLKENGDWERTIVVITADHGEAFGEHGTLRHGVSVFDEQMHVPLYVKVPKQEGGRVVETRVSLVDVLPSLLEMLDLPPPPGLHGRSFLRMVPDPQRVVFAENTPITRIWKIGARYKGTERAAYVGAEKLRLGAEGNFESYDLGLDPKELAPSPARDTPAAVRMVIELDRYIRAVGFGRLLSTPEVRGDAFPEEGQGYTR